MFFWAKIEIGLPIFALLCDFFALDATKVLMQSEIFPQKKMQSEIVMIMK
jgi:hypothetical protein